MLSNFTEVNGINMHYIEKGEGCPLILLHGGIGTAEFNWSKQIEFFSNYFRVIAVDSRGHGRTNNPTEEFSYKLMADDMAAFIQKMKLEKPLIMGWSDGGQIALEIGIRHPDLTKALIVGGVLSEITDHYSLTMKSWGINGPGEVNIEKMMEVIPQFTQKLPELHSSIYGDEYWKKLLQDISHMWLDPSSFPGKLIKQINNPILIIAGDRDEANSTDEYVKMYKQIPNAELAIIPNAAHDVYETKTELFNNIVLEFLMRYME
ncbi:MAG: alpha/beta fold hydrolase [Candidatus Thorarchaeota archaeon]